MIFAEPQRSPYDLHFSLFGVPVRVHPMFWAVSLLMGLKLEDPVLVLLWVVASFFSILVHELGHVAAYRYYGTESDVVLYSFGGLAIARHYRWRGNWEQVLISFGGPLAGFIVAGFIFAGLTAAQIAYSIKFGFPMGVNFDVDFFEPYKLYVLVDVLLQINLYWGLVNLLPIFPLDGGQIARALLEEFRVPDATRKSQILSVAAAGFMALVGLQQESVYIAIMFGYLAFQSYQSLQHRGGFY